MVGINVWRKQPPAPPSRTKEQNCLKQKRFQRKRRAHNLIAYRWLMAKINGSKRGLRLIQTMLRRVGKGKESTPAQVLSAAKWLLYIETGKRLPNENDLPATQEYPPPLKPSEVEQNSVVSNPTISPDDDDSSIVASLTSKLKV